MKYYGMTNIGLLRRSNQDSYVIAHNAVGDTFAMVCDGIGGSKGGDIASHLAVSYFSEVFAENEGFASVDEVKDWLHSHIQVCNHLIFTKGTSSPKYKGMGTTLCGVLICKQGKFVINIGDSRTYGLYPDGSFKQLTIDHTLVEDMVMHGEITAQDAKSNPHKNVLTNALGVWDTVRSDIDTHEEPISSFLICSDGLHGYVDDSLIEKVMKDTNMDPSYKARRLIRFALEAGGYDNVTVIMMDVKGDEAQ